MTHYRPNVKNYEWRQKRPRVWTDELNDSGVNAFLGISEELKESLKLRQELIDSLQLNGDDSKVAISRWHQKMSELRLTNLRLGRENFVLTEKKDTNAKEQKDLSDQVSELEDTITILQSEMDTATLEWERREFDYEQKLFEHEEERDRILKAATASEVL